MSIEEDVLVAEKVFGEAKPSLPANGWSRDRSKPMISPKKCWCMTTNGWIPAPFTSNVATDYRTLCHVRETWDLNRQADFLQKLADIWGTKMNDQYGKPQDTVWCVSELRYEPGDYSLAALQVMSK